MLRPDDIQSIGVSFATTEAIRGRSFGAVTEAATSDKETGAPVAGGLFDPAIFGSPEAEGCVCGTLSGEETVDRACPDCGAVSGRGVAYRRRSGHIDLCAPAIHPWLLYQPPRPLACLLALTPADAVAVAHYEKGLVLEEVGEQDPPRVAVVDDPLAPGALTGPEGIRQALDRVGLRLLALSEDYESRWLLRALSQSGAEPTDLVLEAIPVMPAGMRPRSLVQDGVAVAVEANDLYMTVLQRNRRLAGAIADGLPEALRLDLARSLQEAVEALLDSGSDRRRSLATLLRGKEGIFRQNLLGKRLDYSGRSVIIPAPDMDLDEVGLPLAMALELFRPHVMGRLLRSREASTLMAARQLLAEQSPLAVKALLDVCAGHPVLLNRAPTLHRLGLQAFYPRIIEGSAIALHPLTCCAFNADFDGDQMAVHVPLTPEAIEEARTRLFAPLNIFSPGTGEPLAGPTQDMVVGWAYATRNPDPGAEPLPVGSLQEARDLALAGAVEMNAPVIVPLAGAIVHTTAGRAILNLALPESLRPCNQPVDKRALTDLVRRCRDSEGTQATIDLVNELHRIGFALATRSGISVSWSDYPEVASRDDLVAQARSAETEGAEGGDVRGAWLGALDRLQQDVRQAFGLDNKGRNPLSLIVSSGARGQWHMLRQSVGVVGPLAPVGYAEEALEVIDRGYVEGLSPVQREAHAKTVRRSLANTMYRATTCGVLGRRLVNATVDTIVTTADCGTARGIPLAGADAIGRRLAEDVTGPDGNFLAPAGAIVEETLAQAGVEAVLVRSPLTCETIGGVCATCYGASPETGGGVTLGMAVGVSASQAVTEAATQLTFRTYYGPGAKPVQSDAPLGLLRLVALSEAEGIGIDADGRRWLPVATALQELGEEAVGAALAADMHRVFGQQGVPLDRRHFEVIARALLSRVRVLDPGDTDLLVGETIGRDWLRELSASMLDEGKRPPRATATVTPIAELGQVGDSFLAAAAYGNPAEVLSRAALKGATDDLRGVRERLILGKLIPVGTGWEAQR